MVAQSLMPPPPSKAMCASLVAADPPATLSKTPEGRPQNVLDEDEWTMRMEQIVERDYYPDLPKLKDRLEWLEAHNSGNPARVSEAIANITRRRGATPGRTPSVHPAGTP
eukprot:CAMPEP_0114256920 /NCGR_PEP_ID=MMETSP0058-20121206/18439_1 /TAXON_ID=36894 /ORGANISM="Pyramimonas parkeae, CCMP726" /LENGTH=109 /DNA_ID=CAMNT_0001371577 /DNA_START=290 /DNA_END=615 /DNA_ORIENTATION=-